MLEFSMVQNFLMSFCIHTPGMDSGFDVCQFQPFVQNGGRNTQCQQRVEEKQLTVIAPQITPSRVPFSNVAVVLVCKEYIL